MLHVVLNFLIRNMRHRVNKLKLGKSTSEQRKALIRALVTSLFTHERLQTTQSRAKAIQPVIDRLMSKISKKDKMNAIRELKKVVYTVDASKKAFEIYEKLKDRSSGFTRIMPLKIRQGDAAKIVQIEFVTN